MKVRKYLSVCMAATLCISLHAAQEKEAGEMQSMYNLMDQFSRALNEIPDDVSRIAVYRIRVDRDMLRPGMARYLREKIEELIAREGPFTVLCIPELKTIRAKVSNDKLTIANALPRLSELRAMATKYRIHAFLECNYTVSDEGDMLLSCKLLNGASGEVIWTRSFIAGPNSKIEMTKGSRIFVSAPVYISPVKEFQADTASLGSGRVHRYGLRLCFREMIPIHRRLSFGVNGGASMFQFVSDGGDSTVKSVDNSLAFEGGIELGGVVVEKKDRNHGDWISTFLAASASLPFITLRPIVSVSHGYRIFPTRHFGIGGGIHYVFAFSRELSISEPEMDIELEMFTYEVHLIATF